jgi:predicted tellurium resistance membrane protein TerC
MEILSSTTVEEYTAWGGLLLAFGILFLLVGVGSTLAGFLECESGIAAFGAFLLVIAIPMMIVSNDGDFTKSHKEYKVLVTDYNEIYEKGYEIIAQDGKMLTIKKEDE